MAMTKRDKWILAAMPAILTGLIYAWGYGRPVSRNISELRTQAVQAQQSVVSTSVISAKQEALDELQDKVNSARELSEGLNRNNAGAGLRQDRTAASGTLMRLFNSHRVLVVSMKQLKSSTNEHVPPQMEALWKTPGAPA